MGKRVFETAHAPIEEIDGVKAVLEQAGIRYYETPHSNWGFSAAALWVSDPQDYSRARQAIDEFQRQWRDNARKNRVKGKVNWWYVPPLLFILVLFILVTIQSLYG